MQTGFGEKDRALAGLAHCGAVGGDAHGETGKEESGPDGGRIPALTGSWVCPRHLPMAPRPEPSTKKAILAPLLEVRWGYLHKSVAWFCAMGWGRAGTERALGMLEQSRQDGAKRWGKALRCIEDTFRGQSAVLSRVPEMLGVVWGCASEQLRVPFAEVEKAWFGVRTIQEMACLSVKIWTEEPGGLQSVSRRQLAMTSNLAMHACHGCS